MKQLVQIMPNLQEWVWEGDYRVHKNMYEKRQKKYMYISNV